MQPINSDSIADKDNDAVSDPSVLDNQDDTSPEDEEKNETEQLRSQVSELKIEIHRVREEAEEEITKVREEAEEETSKVREEAMKEISKAETTISHLNAELQKLQLEIKTLKDKK